MEQTSRLGGAVLDLRVQISESLSWWVDLTIRSKAVRFLMFGCKGIRKVGKNQFSDDRLLETHPFVCQLRGLILPFFIHTSAPLVVGTFWSALIGIVICILAVVGMVKRHEVIVTVVSPLVVSIFNPGYFFGALIYSNFDLGR